MRIFDCTMIVDNKGYMQVLPFYVDQDGRCIAEAICIDEADEILDELEEAGDFPIVPLYELVYDIPEVPEESSANWFDLIDWDKPEEIRPSQYGWHWTESRHV